MSKTFHRTLDNEKDDRWRRKGVVHTGKDSKPDVCPACNGWGWAFDNKSCPVCEGEGVVYD